MPTINNGFNYTFRYDKSAITSNSPATKKKSFQDFLYDLENTYLINQELVITIIQTLPLLSQEQKSQLLIKLDLIQGYFNKKKSNLIEKRKLSSKMLINKQIVEESKRRNDENYLYFSGQLGDTKENIGKKTAIIKQFHKKFFEVEVFVQREAKSNMKKYGKFSSFQIVPFINSNEAIICLRNSKDKENKETQLRNQLMASEVNDIRINYKQTKLSKFEEIEKGLVYLQRKIEFLKGLLNCFMRQKYRYRYKGNKKKEDNDNYNENETETDNKNDDSYDKRLLTMVDGNIIEKQITEISVIENEKNFQNKFEMLETEPINIDIKESNY